ncbi:hypothetical protein JCM8202_006063 [Rhodotorula sphaerocarpa]
MSAKGTASETAPGSPPTEALAQLDVQGKEEPASPSADAESSEPRSATSPPDASTELQTSRDSAEPHVDTVELPAAGAPEVTAAEADVTEPEAVDDDEAALAAAQGAQEEDEAARDPAVEQLRALFPNVDLEIVEAVLAASGGSLDEATEQLLVLSDPTYKPDPVEMSQLEADEELARQLAQEDEAAAAEQRRRRAAARQTSNSGAAPQGGEGLTRPLTYQPYVPRARRGTTNSTSSSTNPGMSNLSPSVSPSSTSWQPPSQPAPPSRERSAEMQTRDEFDEIGEQITKFAEQGRKTFSNLFSRVKEGVARMDEAIVRSASPSSSSVPAEAPPVPRKDYTPAPPTIVASDAERSAGPSQSAEGTTTSVVPDRLPRPESLHSNSSGRSGSVSPGLAPPRAASPLGAPSPTTDAKPAQKPTSPNTLKPVVPGFLPRQSFSLLDADKSKSPSASPGDQPAAKAGAATGGQTSGDDKRARKESGGSLIAPNHRLEDSDDDDELEYSRSPFEDDD